ncbi:MAG: hypothetical protein KAQ96_00165 [Thermoplasmata archaeon]|nr:hypothetical protein [Thermoplasmata archaeon]
MLLSLAALLLMQTVGGDGLPDVTITSPSGITSGTYQLNVTVTGDLQAGEVYYGVDDEDPSTIMTDLGEGDFQADIDTTPLTDGPHTIYVKAINGTGQEVIESIQIDIDTNSPHVVLTSEGGVASGDFLVTATVEDAYLDETAIYCVIDDDLEASRGYVLTRVDDHFEITIDTTAFPDGGHFFRIWAFDLWGSYNKSQADGMVVDNTPPVIEITSDGGLQSGTYVLRATVTDPNLLGQSVEVTVGGEDSMGMTEEADDWTWMVDTTTHPNGDLVLKVEASDSQGHTASQTITITVINMADLVISDVEWSDISIMDGENLQANVTVRNGGSVSATGFKIVIAEDGNVLATTLVTVPLDPGASSDYTVEWTAKGIGKRTLSVQVDPDDAVPEVDEDDNTWSQTHEVKVEEESPGPGVVLAISAITLAMMVIWRYRS